MAKIGTAKILTGSGTETVDVYDVADNPDMPLRILTSNGVGIIPSTVPVGWSTSIRFLSSSGVQAVTNPQTLGNGFAGGNGNKYYWTAPDGLLGQVTIRVEGAGGGGAMSEDGSDGGNGRAGGKIVAEVDVQPGETLYLYAGEGGRRVTYTSRGRGGWGAHNGGGGSYGGEGYGGNGGGSSEVRLNSDTDSATILSAGGGQGGTNPYSGGSGGGHAGEGGGGEGSAVNYGSRILSQTTTVGGGGAGGIGRENNYSSDHGGDGYIMIDYLATEPADYGSL